MQQRLIWFKLLNRHHSQKGMTLVETLVVTVILTVMVIVTTPPLILGMATRIQNRRAETAVTLAQKEIERIRLVVARGDYTNSMLPPRASQSANEMTEVSAPNSIQNNPPCTDPNQTVPPCILNSNNNSVDPNHGKVWWTADKEFLVQTFRDEGVVQVLGNQQEQVVVFRMGIRVYSKVAVGDLNNLRTESAPLYLSTSPGTESVVQREGQVIRAKHSQFPLAVIYTDFSRGDLVGSLERYHEFTE
ncbi:type II secretion system protein [Gloeocapsa sp. PCC 73106]|uniref:type II secretion system protein n=1 Tax=Gloeocapsa sp. PCC 73106 TaxID=102232 RepID=UPI0002AC87C6|nr:type II secretion system protein [Gloeocapsa sp. PCC 73106]ELR97277.1 prepilin-type N-terminal cleavage/methylation domain-containing protein [Gloeocapsa sp. PCC 73106]